MSMKALIVTAAGVLTVSPAFAMSNSQITHHTGGPIPYSQFVSMDKSGYNARSHHKSKSKVTSDTSVAANATTDSASPPAPAAPDANAPSTSALPPATAPGPAAPSPTTPSAGAATSPSGQPQ